MSARHQMFILNKNSNLEVVQILEMIWYFANNHSVKYTTEQTKLNKKTIINWFAKI